MNNAVVQKSNRDIVVRPARAADLDLLLTLENEVFSSDRISRRGFRRFLAAGTATLIVCDIAGEVVGYALVLFREGTPVARLYSIAVAPAVAGQGIGKALLAAAEAAATERHCVLMRLEVHSANTPAIALYRRSGYFEFGRRSDYYADGGEALRLEKRIAPAMRALDNPPPYFHQTTEFTCGPACMMMALAWSNPLLRPSSALEFKLWREATTIFMASGPGGCDPYGIGVTLRKHGLRPEIHVSHPGPYFLDTARSKNKQRVMRLAQEEFRHEANALDIPIHLAPLGESLLMEALDRGAVAIVLMSGYRMIRRHVPHWVFVFAREGRYLGVHDPAAKRNEEGGALAPETYALPWSMFNRMTQFGRDNLSAALLIRKGQLQ
jgi:ribosomal protein S18 acetylase RimI-like enzyme